MSDQEQERPENRDRDARLEELRFAKRQQWYIAPSGVTLLGAIFAIAHQTQLNDVEKVLASIFIALIAGFGIFFLFRLQDHLKNVRRALDPIDPNPWFRGVDVFLVLAGLVFLSAVVVLYFLWLPHVPNVRC